MARFKTVLRHSSYLFGSKIISRLLFTVFVVLVASRLGSELFGAFSFSLAMVELLSWFGDLGTTRYGTRELVRVEKKQWAVVNGQILVLQVLSSTLISVAGLLALLLWSPGYPKMQMLLIGLVAVLLSGVINATESSLIASQNFLYSSLLSLIGRLVFLVLGFIAITRGASVVMIMAGYLAGVIIESFLRIILVTGKVSRFSFQFSFADIKAMFVASLPLAAVALASVIFTQSGIIALEILDGDAAVGVFNIAYSLYMPFIWFAMVLSKAVFPGQAELYKDDRDAARRNYRQWYRLVVMAGIPIPVATTLLAGPALSLLPSEYEESTTVLIILMWALPLALIGAMQGNVMQMIGRELAQVRMLIVGIVIIVVLQIILIPKYGVVGAPIAALTAALVKEIMVYEDVRRTFFGKMHYLVLLLRPLLGGLIMALATLLAWGLGPWLATSVGLAAYIVTMFASGGVSISEIKALARN